ncbi:MAG: SIR2 family protein, partial [Verrucomicrobiaceae bacterium]
MVGAGFSLNSQPLPGVKSRFPTWRQLVWSMFDELYPTVGNETPIALEDRIRRFDGIDALRLASEYEAAFGPRKLECLIRNLNPDSEHIPSKLHSLLLQLPWRDVFTTNYDTLLERTEIAGRAYQPVTVIGDLTLASQPRIVKLHGSLPSQTPFIITEEDYRTYPRRFAPFVNTVQQALIENCLVMVGFSGDDPNFLQWIGWIRDHLGQHHAPIYLVGPLSLSIAQRTLLDRRGVSPIDLSPVFSGYNPAAGIHAASLDWFLKSLLVSKPQRPEKWTQTESVAEVESVGTPPL